MPLRTKISSAPRSKILDTEPKNAPDRANGRGTTQEGESPMPAKKPSHTSERRHLVTQAPNRAGLSTTERGL
jgi:hypothetical protein